MAQKINNKQITNPYRFSVYRAAAHVSNTSPAIINFDTKLFDPNNNFSTTTYRYTAPVTGTYWLNGLAGNTAATNTLMYAIFFKNGTVAKQGNVANPTIANNRQSISGLVELTAGDYVDMRFVGGGGSTMATGQYDCYFEGYLISAQV